MSIHERRPILGPRLPVTSTAHNREVPEQQGLTKREITRLVNDWIGVNDGYLGEFTYAKHDRFWSDVCDIDVDTHDFSGTARACFEHTLRSVDPACQAAVVRAILEEYPPADPLPPTGFRSRTVRETLLAALRRIDGTGAATVEVEIESPTDIVRRSLADAQVLLRESGPQSAVDRVHTAMHGYLADLCREAGAPGLSERPTMNQLFKSARSHHPALKNLGPRSDEIGKIFNSMANILDALNPVRNNASVAHPNEVLVGEAEAVLLINTVHTLLGYLEAKRRQAPSPLLVEAEA